MNPTTNHSLALPYVYWRRRVTRPSQSSLDGPARASSIFAIGPVQTQSAARTSWRRAIRRMLAPKWQARVGVVYGPRFRREAQAPELMRASGLPRHRIHVGGHHFICQRSRSLAARMK